MLNQALLIGNLGQDPEIRHAKSGDQVATLSIATNRKWKDKSGQYQEETEWHRVTAWGAAAEFCGKYLRKGDKVYVSGRIHTRKWKDQSGNDRYATEIIANDVKGLTTRSVADGDVQQHGGDEDVPF